MSENAERYALITAAFERGRNEADTELRATVARLEAENGRLRAELSQLQFSARAWRQIDDDQASYEEQSRWASGETDDEARAARDPQP